MNLYGFRPPKSKAGWILLVVGIAVLWFSVSGIVKGLSSTNWPKADGVITYSQLDNGWRYARIGLRYQYTVDGKQYTGSRWHYQFIINRDQMRSWQVEAVQAAYPVGQKVKVSASPGDPAESVLEPGASLDDLIWVFAGIACLIGSFSPRRDKRRAAASPGKDRTSARHSEHDKVIPRADGPRYRNARFVAAIGAVVLAIGLYWIYRGVASEFWPTVQGKIIYSSLRGQTSSGSYRGIVRYEYALQGTRYVGNSDTFAAQDYSKDWVRAHRVDTPVTVHYNPRDASDSAIATGISWRDFVMPVIAAVIFAVAWLLKKLAEASWRMDREKTQAKTSAQSGVSPGA
jgi:hypothetical protein